MKIQCGKNAYIYGGAAAILAGIIGGVGIMIESQRRIPEPEIHETLSSGLFGDAGLRYLVDEKNQPSLEHLVKYFKEIKGKAPPHYIKQQVGWPHPVVSKAYLQNMSLRLCYSVMRSIEMEDKNAKKQEYGDSRSELALVPIDFANEFKDKGDDYPYKGYDYFVGIMYLKHCLGTKKSRHVPPDTTLYAIFSTWSDSK